MHIYFVLIGKQSSYLSLLLYFNSKVLSYNVPVYNKIANIVKDLEQS